MRRIAPWIAGFAAVVVAGLLVLLLTTDRGITDEVATPLLNQPAPAATGEYADGDGFELNRRLGSWVVLNFFADNCVPCVREHPELIRFVDQQASIGLDGAEFYSIVQYGRPVDAVEEFFAERGGDWPVVYDTRSEFATRFGVAQVPETWIIDPDGIVRGRVIGELGTADFLSAELQRLREALA